MGISQRAAEPTACSAPELQEEQQFPLGCFLGRSRVVLCTSCCTVCHLNKGCWGVDNRGEGAGSLCTLQCDVYPPHPLSCTAGDVLLVFKVFISKNQAVFCPCVTPNVPLCPCGVK